MSTGRNVLPVAVGLAAGIAFIASLAYGMANSGVTEYAEDLREFATPDKLAEVKLLQKLYPDYLGILRRSPNDTILFDYQAWKRVDTDGNGYGETLRRMDLFLEYDESNGLIEDNPNARLIEMKVTCTSQSPEDIREFVDIIPQAYGKDVMNFIRNSQCLAGY